MLYLNIDGNGECLINIPMKKPKIICYMKTKKTVETRNILGISLLGKFMKLIGTFS